MQREDFVFKDYTNIVLGDIMSRRKSKNIPSFNFRKKIKQTFSSDFNSSKMQFKRPADLQGASQDQLNMESFKFIVSKQGSAELQPLRNNHT